MMHSAPALSDYVHGDDTGLLIPAHGAALQLQGAEFLTRAFQAFGSLSPDNRVARIARLEPCPGGSTGQKLFLTVEYEKPEPHLHTELFVKFSRDFEDAMRDHGRYEMESEARFAAVSRLPGFPIDVPAAYFADYRQACGTGVLITQRIPFGEAPIEPHRRKFLDYQLDDPLPYYRAIVKALGRLAGADKAGELSPDIAARFPFDPEGAGAADKIRYDERQLRDLVAKYADFAASHPQLLPDNIRKAEFIAKLDREVGGFLEHEAAIKRALQSNGDFIALCHWNANIDNAWFWRDEGGALQCGLMDWGRVRQLNVAFALWGCLSGAPVAVWNRHFDELLALFVDEFAAHGGPRLDADELKLHMQLYVATMGLAWLMEAPARILFRLPEAASASGPHDPVFLKNDSARGQLNVMTAFLNLWETHDFGASLQRLLQRG